MGSWPFRRRPENGSGVRAGSRFLRYWPRLISALFHRNRGRWTVSHRPLFPRLKTLWIVWKGVFGGFCLGEDAHPAELGPTTAPELLAGNLVELRQGLGEPRLEEHRGSVVVELGASVGLRNDGVDDPQLEAVQCVGLERRGRFLRLAGVASIGV